MPRDGSGKYVLPAGNPVVPDTAIETGWANPTMSDIANALTSSISSDGQTTPTSNLPMGGFKHTGVADPTSRNQYATLGMTQDGRDKAVSILSGTDNLVGSLVGNLIGYYPGQYITFTPLANNTGPATISINGLAAVSLLSRIGKPLVADDLVAGALCAAIYTNTNTFQLTVSAGAEDILSRLVSSTTGWVRPSNGLYPVLVVASGTQVTVPAGSGRIVPPGQFGFDSVDSVNWSQQTVTINNLSASFTTALLINASGQVVQYSGRPTAAALRENIMVGVVSHVAGTVTSVYTAPSIYGDDGYLGADTTDVLTNQIVSGATATRSGVAPLSLAISGGFALMAGGQADAVATPNYLPIAANTQISFRTLVGSGTIGAPTTTAPITQYDNGGVLTTIPANGDAVVHRLYYIYGEYLWVFGQRVYASIDAALQRIDQERSLFTVSTKLNDAVMIAEIVCTKATTDLATTATCAIMNRGALYYGIGTAGGLTDAPADGSTYGRRNNAWSPALSGTNPAMTGDATITKADPKMTLVDSPVGGGTAAYRIQQLSQQWFSIEASPTDDKAYLRSYDPTNSNLRYTAIYDLANGQWTFPGEVYGTNSSLTAGGTGRLLPVGAFGLGADTKAAEADLNLITRTGHYVANSSTLNSPLTGDFTVNHVQGSIAGAGSQSAMDLATGAVYTRAKLTGSWTVWQTVTGGGTTMKIQTFIASGTWVRPVGVDAVELIAVGGGQGGSGFNNQASANLACGGGGGGGQVVSRSFAVTGNITITIGAGGAGGIGANATANSDIAGSSGGDTTLTGGVALTCKGGGPGGNGPGGFGVATNVNSAPLGGGGAGSGVAFVGELYRNYSTHPFALVPGSAGFSGDQVAFSASIAVGGSGLAGYGGGGNGGTSSRAVATVDGGGKSTGTTPNWPGGNGSPNTGGGGAGGTVLAVGTVNGGTGADGLVIIKWWE